MKKIKALIGILIIIIILTVSLLVNAYASTAPSVTDDTVFEKGRTYSVNGVDYFIEEDGGVTVKGAAIRGVPERVELLSELGGYKVTKIGYGAFYRCKTVKEVIVPETVTAISERAFSASELKDIEIKGNNVNIKTIFSDTPLFSDSPENWENDVLYASGYAVVSFARGEVIFSENVRGISECCFSYSNSARDITVLDPDCFIPDSADVFPARATVYGYKNSTAQRHAEKYGNRFSLLCKCEDTVFVPATKSLCDKTVGLTAGYWCERCNIYSSGGAIDTSFEHKDADGDNICELCKLCVDSEITKMGKCGDNAVWTLDGEGVLRMIGTGDVYYYADGEEPWYGFKNDIKSFIAEDGLGGLSGISFADHQSLQRVIMAESCTSIPRSFRNCTSLKDITFPKYAYSISSHCFEGCTSLESIYLPKNIARINTSAFRNCTRLRDIDFETGYVELESGIFYGTAAYSEPDNIKDGILYIDNCLIKQLTPGAETLVLGPEITSVASGWDYFIDKEVTSVEIYNRQLVFPRHTGVFPYDSVIKGYYGSTAYSYCQNFSGNFEALEAHTHTEIIDIPAIIPTEEKAGYTHQSICSLCGIVMSERKRISHSEYEILISGEVVTASKVEAASDEENGEMTVIKFAVLHDVATSTVSRTVIYKVGEVKLSSERLIYNGSIQKPAVSVKNSKGEILLNGRDYKLTYLSESKYCGKYSVRVDYIGNFAGSKTLYYDIYIPAVEPEIYSLSDESVALSWEDIHEDIVYRIYSEDADGNLRRIADTKGQVYAIESLEEGTEYRFLVRAFVTDENGNVYWGDMGDAIICETFSQNKSNSVFDFIRRIIARFRYILQTLFMLKGAQV